MFKVKEDKSKIPKIVVIGGGTGVFTVLSGLKKYKVDLASIISMSDDGGSTGVLREEFGILPPGDIRRAIVAMAPADHRLLADLLNYRFEEGGLKGHTFGNIMLTALERLTGSFEIAVDEACRLLGVRGEVLPVTLDNVRLCAKLEDGMEIRGETNIDIPKHDGNLAVKKVWLEPPARPNIRALYAIREADMIVLGPGDLYSSIIPNLVVRGIPEAIRKSQAKKIYVVNLMTKWGETNNFAARDFIAAVEDYLGRDVLDFVLINTKRPSPMRLRLYEEEFAKFVETNDLPEKPVPILGDFLRRRGFIRHDPDKLAKALLSLV